MSFSAGGGGGKFSELAVAYRGRIPLRKRGRGERRYGKGMSIYKPSRRGSTAVTKNTVHRFTRICATNQRLSAEAVTTNYWAINNRSLNNISYGGTTPNVFGNQISIYFDLLSVHMDLYSDAGASIASIEYNVPSVAEFIALYEEYRIDWVQIDMNCSCENAFRAGSASDVPQNSAILYIVKDYNDADSTSLTQMMQQQDVVTWQPGIGNAASYHKRVYVKPRPKFLVANTSGGSSGATAEIPGMQWFSTDDGQLVPHYGVKLAASSFFPTGDLINTASNYINFTYTYHLSFRNTK